MCNKLPTLSPPRCFGSSMSFHGARTKEAFSGQPPHKNWRCSLFIFSMTPWGIGKTDMKYKYRLDKEALMRVNQPPRERSFRFHIANFLFIRAIMRSQEQICEMLSTIGRPKYVNGRVPILQRRQSAAFCSHTSSVRKSIKELLWKFTYNPEAR